jgi:hypothetical protein
VKPCFGRTRSGHQALIMTRRCAHTGLSIPECSCRACLIALVEAHAPRPAASPAQAPPRPPEDGADQRPQAEAA